LSFLRIRTNSLLARSVNANVDALGTSTMWVQRITVRMLLLPPGCLGKTDSTCGARDHLNIDCMSTSSRNFSVELTFSSNSQSSCVQYLPCPPLRSFRQLRHPLFFKLDSSTSLAQAPAPAPASALAPVYTSHPSSIQPRVVALYLLPPRHWQSVEDSAGDC